MEKPDRLVFFSHDSIYSRVMLDYLLSQKNIEVVAVVLSTCIMRRGKHEVYDYWRLIKKCGFKYIAHLLYVTLIYPVLGQKYFKSIGKQQKQHGFKLIKTVDVNSHKIFNQLKELNADYFLSGYFNQIFASELLAIPRKKALNIHPSLLPMWQGVDPVISAFANNDSKLGVTLHLLTDKIDQGCIYAQRKLLIPPKNIIQIYIGLFKNGVEMFAEHKDSKIIENSKEQESPHYYSWPTKKDYLLALRFMKNK